MLTQNKNKRLLIIGSGGHGRVIADYAELIGHYNEIAFLDDSYGDNNKSGKWFVIGDSNDWQEHITNSDFIVAFSNNINRSLMLDVLFNAGVSVVNIIHPRAVISKNTTLGQGITIFANAVINVGAKLDDGCIINTAATIDHDCFLGKCVHISPGVHLAGNVSVGENAWLGIGTSVIEGIKLAKNIQVAAGAVVIKADQANSLYMGIPAKVIRPLDIEHT
jgi:sugar O-acyltransferase (sialic acid O-acetyltransferase NeuD family)